MQSIFISLSLSIHVQEQFKFQKLKERCTELESKLEQEKKSVFVHHEGIYRHTCEGEAELHCCLYIMQR